jgi:hypothetical protein
MDSVQTEMFLSALRHLLTVIGGILVARGLADKGTVEEIVGPLIILVSLALSLHQKRRVAEHVDTLNGKIYGLQNVPEVVKPPA